MSYLRLAELFTLAGLFVYTGFEWGTVSGNYTNDTIPGVWLSGTGSFHDDLTGLSANTTYYFRAKAVGDGAGYGVEKSFTTTAVTSLRKQPTQERGGWPHFFAIFRGCWGYSFPFRVNHPVRGNGYPLVC